MCLHRSVKLTVPCILLTVHNCIDSVFSFPFFSFPNHCYCYYPPIKSVNLVFLRPPVIFILIFSSGIFFSHPHLHNSIFINVIYPRSSRISAGSTSISSNVKIYKSRTSELLSPFVSLPAPPRPSPPPFFLASSSSISFHRRSFPLFSSVISFHDSHYL